MRKKLLLFSLVLTALIVGGVGYYSVLFPQVEVNQKLLEEAENQVLQINYFNTKQIEDNLADAKLVVSTSVRTLQAIYENQEYLGDVPTYYHNVDVFGSPPGYFYDPVRNESISYEVSSYKIAPRSFNNSYQDSYLNNPETEDPLLYVDDNIRKDIQDGAQLTGVWKDLIQTNPQVEQVSMAFESGVITTYPFRSFTKSYDPVDELWYKSAISGVKDVVIVLDRSGSMEGEKMDVLRNVTKEIILGLGGKDRFNIVTFSDQVKTFRNGLENIHPQIIEESNVFLDTTVPGGTTDILSGMSTALDILADYGHPKNQKVVIFVTDGKATTGETNREVLVEELAKSNGLANAELLLYGFGEDADYQLLQDIVNATSGYSAWYNSTENFTRFVPEYNNILAQKFPNQNEVWGSPELKENIGPVISVSQPVYVKDKLIGVMEAVVKLASLKDSLSIGSDFPSQYEFIIDAGGLTVVHPSILDVDVKDWTEENSRINILSLESDSPTLSALLDGARRGERVVATLENINEVEYTYAMAPISNTGLILGTVVSFDELVPQEVFLKVSIFKLDPILLLPGLLAGLSMVFVTGIIAPYFIEEEEL